MNPLELARAAAGNTLRSKTRTTLTVLAIFIGAFTLTITSAVGTGVSDYIANQIGVFGAPDVLTITKTAEDAPERTEGPTPYDPEKAADGGSGGSQFETPHLTVDDLEVIRGVDGVLDVSAVQHVSPRYVEYGDNGKFELLVNVDGVLVNPDLASGRQLEGATSQGEILLVTSYVDSLGFSDARAAVGETVTIGVADYAGELHEVQSTVVGVLHETILASGAAVNNALADELYRVQSIGSPAAANGHSLQARANFDASWSDAQIKVLQGDLDGLGYTATTVADQIGDIQAVVGGIIGVLNAFAVIALIAAGFGIINTLLMSVQERTREIGLMKALGMGGGRIFALFSMEAVFIGYLGSAFGAVAAITVGTVANELLAGTALADLDGLQVLRFELIPVATIMLLVMGIAFLAGTLPARRASRQNPIDALRYE
jgi:putative ABC transport system permease protein